jgi:hypothetical protein
MSVPGSALLVITLVAAAGLAVASGAQAQRADRPGALSDRCFAAPSQGGLVSHARQGPCRP